VATQLQIVVGALERPGSGASSTLKSSLAGVEPQLRGAIEHLSAAPQGNKPVTLGIGEPFTTHARHRADVRADPLAPGAAV